MTDTKTGAKSQSNRTRRTVWSNLVGTALLLVPLIWLPAHMYFEGRRNADALCSIARSGMPIDAVTAKATALHVEFLDDRKHHNRPDSTDGELISLASPKTLRRTCVVDFRNGVVVRVVNSRGPN